MRSKDGIAPTMKTAIHFNNDVQTLTIFGGIITMIVKIYVLFIALSQGIKMVTYKSPYMIMTQMYLGDSDLMIMEERSFKDLNKLTFYFQDWQYKEQTDY